MKNSPKNKVVHVYGNDGGALYINGKLISSYFTTVQSDILAALNIPFKSKQLDQKWYNENDLPENLSDCKFLKKTT
jgi:hypothetical protein